MTLLDRLNHDMKEAMRSKDKQALGVIRMVKASIQNEAIKLGKDQLTEDEELSVLSRELKQRNDSLQEFENAGRDDLVEKTKDELNVLQKYMPEQLSDEELTELVVDTIKAVGAESKSDMGKVMGALMPKVKGKADGGKVNQLVMEHLS
ncbi:GatB/YqeY domain-containing protein [Salinibacillus xinjiangensis]|uniref:GatB/YqeY domain-containing protein n=1 Tax=Salinibacillus xinjiangensis TaxID=1229268 RepID=A0A6G1X6V4_9BACI|nr:GatB/YqeY domain-containing protein [Salinibacillus xinjiangensis]MRG86636.1 GatB/YqeY domain-containing protein [Salinibacillus xinjiangensis]